MGTSASNKGPQGSPPLLPPWYDNDGGVPPAIPPPPPGDPENNDNPGNDNGRPADGNSGNPEGGNDNPRPAPVPRPNPVPGNTGNWRSSKGALGRLARGTNGSSGRKAAKSYVRSLGGSGGATRAAANGISTGSRYAGFLRSVTENGFTATLRRYGLGDFIGRSAEAICTAIADVISPIGSTTDEAISRDAMITTWDTLCTRLTEEGRDLTELENMGPDTVKDTLIEYVSNYIFTKWMHELGNRVEARTVSETEAIRLEREVRELILEEVRMQYRDADIGDLSLDDADNKNIITDIFRTAYSTLEQ